MLVAHGNYMGWAYLDIQSEPRYRWLAFNEFLDLLTVSNKPASEHEDGVEHGNEQRQARKRRPNAKFCGPQWAL